MGDTGTIFVTTARRETTAHGAADHDGGTTRVTTGVSQDRKAAVATVQSEDYDGTIKIK